MFIFLISVESTFQQTRIKTNTLITCPIYDETLQLHPVVFIAVSTIAVTCLFYGLLYNACMSGCSKCTESEKKDLLQLYSIFLQKKLQCLDFIRIFVRNV